MTAPSIPRYLQIVEELQGRIEFGDLAPGDRLPSERELAEAFEVNRRTLRDALDVLDRRGLVERRRGAGTFVAAPRLERTTAEFFPFTEGIRHRGFEPGSQIIAVDRIPADPRVAEQLALAPAEDVYRFHRLRTVNQAPFLLETFSLPAALTPGIDRIDLAARSVYDIMEHDFGVVIAGATLSLEAVAMSDFEARWLEMPVGSPAMLERHLAYDHEGRPVDYGYDVYRGDRVRFVTDTATLPEDLPEYDRAQQESQRW